MAEIRLLPSARRDLAAIRDHIATEHPPGAARVVASILARIEMLGLLPQAGTACPDIGPGVRLIVERPYLVLYRHEQDDVLVVRILHGARDIRRANAGGADAARGDIRR